MLSFVTLETLKTILILLEGTKQKSAICTYGLHAAADTLSPELSATSTVEVEVLEEWGEIPDVIE